MRERPIKRFPHRFLGLGVVFFLHGASSFAIAPRSICDGLLRETPLRDRTGEPLYEVVVRDGSREAVVLGHRDALGYMDEAVLYGYDFVNALSAHRDSRLEIAVALTGSAARGKFSGMVHDLDGEVVILAKQPAGSDVRPLSDSTSPEIVAIAEYLRASVSSVLQSHPEYTFIEFKAGEYAQCSTCAIKGVKWTLAEFLAGKKTVQDRIRGTYELTFLEALAQSKARIKVDFAIPDTRPGAPDGAYMEASVVYVIGVHGKNQPRVRYDSPLDSTESIPLRPTVVTFTREEADLLAAVSAGSPSIAIEKIHERVVLNIAKNGGLRFKELRKYRILAEYWDVAEHVGRGWTQEQLIGELNVILENPQMRRWSELYAQSELHLVAFDHHIVLPGNAAQRWVAAVETELGVTGAGPTENRLVQIQEALYRRLNALYDEKIEHLPKARAFVQYVRERNLVLDDGFYEKNTFIAVKPEDAFVSAYQQRLEAWKQEYPALDFTLPEDLHFTFHFSGHMPIRGLNRLLPAVNGAFDGISLTEGHFRIVGRKNNLLAIAFEYEKSVGDRVWEMRHLAVKLGAKPDRQFAGNWLAHATLARPKPGVSLAVFQTQLSAFMAESTGSLGQTSTTRTGVYEGLDDVEAGGIRYQQVIRVPH